MIFRSRIYLLLPMMFLLLSTTCEEDDDPGGSSLRPGSLMANLNGQSVDFANSPYSGDLLTGNEDITGITISGDSPNFSKSLFIYLAPFNGTGEYILDGYTEDSQRSIQYQSAPAEGGIVTGYGLVDGLTGVVNITQFDGEKVEGTFSAEIKCVDCNGNVEMITITNGVINVEYLGDLY